MLAGLEIQQIWLMGVRPRKKVHKSERKKGAVES